MPTPGTDLQPPSPAPSATTSGLRSSGAAATTAKTTPTKKRTRSSAAIKLPLTYVEWEDHHSNDEWQAEDELDHKPRLVYSVGWLVKEDDRVITLATTVDLESIKPYANTITIIKGSIMTRKLVRSTPGTKQERNPRPA